MSFLNNAGVTTLWSRIKAYLTGAHVNTSVISGATTVDAALTTLNGNISTLSGNVNDLSGQIVALGPYNGLDSNSTVAALSAAQGKALKDALPHSMANNNLDTGLYVLTIHENTIGGNFSNMLFYLVNNGPGRIGCMICQNATNTFWVIVLAVMNSGVITVSGNSGQITDGTLGSNCNLSIEGIYKIL